MPNPTCPDNAALEAVEAELKRIAIDGTLETKLGLQQVIDRIQSLLNDLLETADHLKHED